MQHIHINTEQDNREQNTENNTENSTQPQHRTAQNTEYTCSAHNYRTYSFDLYHEFAYIKNNDTIELYTISK